MDVPQRTLRALLSGAAAGAAALAVDQLLVLSTLGYAVPLAGRFVLAYTVLGAALALAVEFGSRLWRREAPRAACLFALALALVYAPAVFERVHHALVLRAGVPAAVAAAALATAGYGLWILLLRRLAGPRAEELAPLLAALTAAAGLAVNRNLVDYPLEAAAVAADVAVLGAGLLLAWAARAAGSRPVLAALGALALGAAIYAGLGGRKPEATSRAGAARQPNLVLVVIDTLRQDVFEAVLEETEEGRAFRQAMGGAAWFTQAIAAAPWTVPSIGTLMTGLHPQEHGFQISAMEDPSRPLVPLSESIQTLAEQLLRARGYWTEAIGTNGFLQPVSGIARGFARYEILSGPTIKLPPLTALARLGLVEGMAYQQASAVRRRLQQRLGPMAASGKPVFLWLHLMDPHSPLQAHRHLTADTRAAAIEPRERLYRDEVRFALAELKRMMEMLREHGMWDDTLLIVVSDHGEMFPSDLHPTGARQAGAGKPGTYGHGHALYEELVRVPLVIRPPGGLPQDRRIAALTCHADVYETVTDLLHLDPTPSGQDRSSLAPWLRNAVPRPRPRGRAYALIGAVQRGPEQRALRTRTLKLIDYPLSRRPNELYLIAGDPREHRDVARPRTRQLARAQRQLERAWSRLGESPEAKPAPLDPETLERLKALGYVP